MVKRPTPYPEVNAVLHTLLVGAQAILGDQFIGMYLHGSLAGGDFDPQRSDVDFLIVTTDELPAEMISALETLHARLNVDSKKWAPKLEGTYIPKRNLRRYDPDDGPYPCINEGRFYMSRHEHHWVLARCILRERGVVVAGPHPQTLIDPVSANDVRQAVLGFLQEWWWPMLDTPTRLQSSEYQAYAVLTMCRALYTLEYGALTSKLIAARWAQQALDGRWRPLIDWALSWQPNIGSDGLKETLDFMRYTLECTQQLEITGK